MGTFCPFCGQPIHASLLPRLGKAEVGRLWIQVSLAWRVLNRMACGANLKDLGQWWAFEGVGCSQGMRLGVSPRV